MPNLLALAPLVSEIKVFKKGTDGQTWLYRLGWSRIYILYGVCHASFCLLRTFYFGQT